MKVSIHTPDMARNLRRSLALVRNKAGFVLVWANAAAREGRDTARSKGGRRWWRDLARSVQVRRVNAGTAEVSSNQPGAVLRQYGGVIRPVRAKALTIPIDPESEGKRAYELERPDRALFRLPGTRLLGYSHGKGKDKAFKPLYVLASKAVQKPDPWFPADSRVMQLAEREVAGMLAREAKQWST